MIRIASRRGSADSLRMLPASFSAGPYRVAPAPGWIPVTAASSRLRSDVERSATSAFDAKNTTEPRSDGFRPLIVLLRRRERVLPAIAVAHAVRAIEEHDDFARAAAARGRRRPCAGRTDARTPARSAPAPPAAARAAASAGSAGAAPTDTESAAGTSATGTARRSGAPAESDAAPPASRGPRGRRGRAASEKTSPDPRQPLTRARGN